jgi:TDG/mug DNA glycosylase family protein
VRIESLKPILGETPLVLILGSIPGEDSLKSGRYYWHKRNHFWRLMTGVLEETEYIEYEERVAMLQRRRIALWDSVASCVRPGSQDKNIREERANDIPKLLREQPTIRAICFNGQASKRLFSRHHLGEMNKNKVEYLTLPSSSPSPGRYVKPFVDKLEEWKKIRHFLISFA